MPPTYIPILSPTTQIHDDIILQLQALPIIQGIIATNRIGTWYDNKGDLVSLGTLSPTNIRVWCDDEGVIDVSPGPFLSRYTLVVSVIVGQDLPVTEITYNLGNAHTVFEAICGSVYYAFYTRQMTFPGVAGQYPTGEGRNGEWIYLGKVSGSDSEEFFEAHFGWKLDYYRDMTTIPVVWQTTATSTTTSTSTSTSTATAT